VNYQNDGKPFALDGLENEFSRSSFWVDLKILYKQMLDESTSKEN
jgi:hypothetical protein